MNTAEENDYRVIDVVPHDHPMSFVDRIEERSKLAIVTSIRITPETMFFEAGLGVPAWVGIEYMAQSIAAKAGADAKDRDEKVKIGFLVSTRRYESNVSYFPPGEQLMISATQIDDLPSTLKTFTCEIRGDQLLVTARLNVFMPENIEQFMQESR